MRGLIDKIVRTPIDYDGRKTLVIDVYGDFAGILGRAPDSEIPL